MSASDRDFVAMLADYCELSLIEAERCLAAGDVVGAQDAEADAHAFASRALVTCVECSHV